MTTYLNSRGHTYLEHIPPQGHHGLLVDALLAHFGAKPGDLAVEIGAGSGRYTRMLTDRGLGVVAVEPDDWLCRRFQECFRDEAGARLMQADLLELESLPEGADWVCGFHVLHHLEKRHLDKLLELMAGSASLKGWLFLEPNAWNPLYLLQLALTPAMSFREERGLWTHDYARLLGGGARKVFRGCLGLFPPRPATGRLPLAVQRLGTSLCSVRTPLHAYCVYGEQWAGERA